MPICSDCPETATHQTVQGHAPLCGEHAAQAKQRALWVEVLPETSETIEESDDDDGS